MVDLLTHALVGYSLGTLLSLRYEWVTPQYVTVCMMGAMIPDMTKIQLVVPSEVVAAGLSVPFEWSGIHTLGGAAISIAIGVILTDAAYRRRVVALLAIGAGSHLVLDALLFKPSGYMAPLWWPLTAQRFAIDGLYLSSDRWPAAVAAVIAAGCWAIVRRRQADRG
ncbi:metal-dependent hydrolase [Halalkalirubrum salinum]|uniref:metal-dependent hydrolase n=1 Tax=Halalkalirubrum salinum TaxID=2563889 RepID=UPI0010FBB378|nr:metal-dependent hydrolase [Halalkalirubrum salinum]